MKKILHFSLLFLLAGMIFLHACRTNNNSGQLVSVPDMVPTESSQQTPVSEPQQNSQPEVEESQMSEEEILATIQSDWNGSPHAAAYVLDESDHNNRCSRCHSPINWQPTMDDLPESCFSCKFELEDPAPFIAEEDWLDIPCQVCHEVGKKDKVDPAYKWLEIAQLDEYAEVSSTTELCKKCHETVGFDGHGGINDLGVHSDLTCTTCHNAHSTQASCLSAGCHDDVLFSDSATPGHQEEHELVSCVACHDAGGKELGFRDSDGLFTTMEEVLENDGDSVFFFASHNLQLESNCQDCHFTENPWGITRDIED